MFIEEYSIKESICDDLIDLFNVAHSSYITTPGVVGDGLEKPSVKKSTDLYMQKLPKHLFLRYKNTIESYMSEVNQCVSDYVDKYKITKYCGGLIEMHPPQIQWYKPQEGFYEWHCDGSESVSNRVLVYLTYLNDVPNGGTEFMHQNYKTTAVKGKTIIFPTGFSHIHRGCIADADKYIITNWIYWNNDRS